LNIFEKIFLLEDFLLYKTNRLDKITLKLPQNYSKHGNIIKKLGYFTLTTGELHQFWYITIPFPFFYCFYTSQADRFLPARYSILQYADDLAIYATHYDVGNIQ
jgi:hypothetical protein